MFNFTIGDDATDDVSARKLDDCKGRDAAALII